MAWILVLIGAVLNALASVFIKMAVTPPRQFPSLRDPFAVFFNWPLLVGLCCFGATFLLYAAALQRLPLSVASPVLTSSSIAITTLFSVVLFHEIVSWNLLVGIGLIVTGVIFITAKVNLV